jgi:hypothetical protein
MRGNLIIGKDFPLRKDGKDIFPILLKKLEIVDEGFGVLKVRNNDQKGPSHLFPPMG